MSKYGLIFVTGLVVGVLAKLGAMAGLLDVQASTAAFLVVVIALGVEVSHDLR